MASRAKIKNTRVSPPQVRRINRHSLRGGFNGFLRALPGEPGFLATVACKIIVSAGSTPASGCQDHTTSPSASMRVVFAQRSVHRIPHPTFVTIAKRPSFRERDGANDGGDLRLHQLRQIGTTGKSPLARKVLSTAIFSCGGA
jgi:hypothetical protein